MLSPAGFSSFLNHCLFHKISTHLSSMIISFQEDFLTKQLTQLNSALHVMCKHIVMACPGVGITYFILESTLFWCSTYPQVTSLRDIPESTSHSVNLSLTFTKCIRSDTKSGKTYVFFFLKGKWVMEHRWWNW